MSKSNSEALIRKDAQWIEQEIQTGRLQRSMAIITGFASIVSGFEAYTQHRRGHFSNRWMWTPVVLTLPMVAASAATVLSRRAGRTLLPILSLSSLLDGVVGFIYHLRGIGRLPGGYRLGRYNIVMGPPVFAPLLMSSVGVLGLLASFFRREQPVGASSQPDPSQGIKSFPEEPVRQLETEIAHGRFQQGMALVAAFFAVLAGGEAYFEHLRGSFNQWIMRTPIWITPPTVIAAVAAARSPAAARRILPFLSFFNFIDGLAGFVFHLRGVRRMPGGFNNIAFNITMGPPLFAPLLFTAVGLLGLIASLLRRE